MEQKNFIILLRRSRPLHLLTAALLYGLGVGIAHYLGQSIDPGLYFLGQAWITSLQLGAYYLGEYLETPAELGLLNRLPFGEPIKNPLEDISKEVALFTSAIFLALTAVLTLLLFTSRKIDFSQAILMGTLFLGSSALMLPRLDFLTSSKELITTFLLIIITPAFGLLLQTGEFHRLLAISTFPLSALHLAMLIMFQFPLYASDSKKNKRTLLIHLGWRRSIQFHNILILTAFLLIGLSVLFGFSPGVALPIFLGLPFGIFQIWFLTRISHGAPTHWRLLTITALLTFGFTSYLFTYMFWTR